MSDQKPSPEAHPLAGLREQLDAIDVTLVETLARRLQLCGEIALRKREHDIPMMQQGRVEFVKQRCAEMGAARGLDPDFVRRLYTLIIDEACRLEELLINEGREQPK
ncbi:chorismate mutase [Archangium violaceum]|uniref:chorismate mutase n=1 Tax=Archangium violaceum TaxID=83451 RepID=UPI0036DC66DE